MAYTPLETWRVKHVKALRILLRYAAGQRSSRTAIPGWDAFCETLMPDPPYDQEDARRRKDRHADQLNHFKEGLNNLDFNADGPCPRLEYVRHRLYEFYRERPESAVDMFDYHRIVYSDDGLTHLDIKLWLAEIYQAQPGPRALARLPGVYHLYRHGMFSDGQPSIVRSSLRITRGAVGDTEYLTFDLRYPSTAERGADTTHRIEGIVLGTLGHYYFIGADTGAARAPYQLIARQHAADEAPSELSGLLMRHSHNNDVIASRILLVRASQDHHGNARPSVYEKEFKEAIRQTRVLAPTEVTADRLLDRRRLARLANSISSDRAPLLWLLPDDHDLPPAPSELLGTAR
jgi:hypothetical protein